MRLLAATLALLFCVTACGGNARQANETSSASIASGPAMTTTASPPPVAPSPPPAAPAPFTVSSPAFSDNTPIPPEYFCNGRNVPPPLRWRTRRLAPNPWRWWSMIPTPSAGSTSTGWSPAYHRPPAKLSTERYPRGLKWVRTPGQRGVSRSMPTGGQRSASLPLYALSKPLTLPTTPAQEAAQTISGAAIASVSTVGLFSG